MKNLCLILVLLSLVSCAPDIQREELKTYPAQIIKDTSGKGLNSFPPLKNGKPITVAVYTFFDKTGQRKPADNIANLSTAVTQGAEIYLIKSLMDIADGKFFNVVERGGLDNLIKERQIIRNTRKKFEGEKGKELGPLKFAGVIIAGGIVGYDSNKFTGGSGVRALGIGPYTEWRVDIVTIGIRLVSVLTGDVLLTVSTEKTILSTNIGINVFKFYDLGTKVLEIEAGKSTNEPVNYAVKQAIELAVVELVKEGKRKKLWDFDESLIPKKYIVSSRRSEDEIFNNSTNTDSSGVQ